MRGSSNFLWGWLTFVAALAGWVGFVALLRLPRAPLVAFAGSKPAAELAIAIGIAAAYLAFAVTLWPRRRADSIWCGIGWRRWRLLLLVTALAAWCALFAIVEAHAEPYMPAGATAYAPLLAAKQRQSWPGAPSPWTLAGLIEQETCASLKSKRCWNPREELKTYREYGFGLGQFTIAYNADRSERFNEFAELKRKYASLSAWRFEDRYDPGYQLIAVIEMTHALWRQVPPAADTDARWAFTLASYNGGLGALLQDRRLCANVAGCDVTRWFGHIETHSLKSKAPQKAYGGQSWYSINRGYVRNVINLRRAKYRQFWSE